MIIRASLSLNRLAIRAVMLLSMVSSLVVAGKPVRRALQQKDHGEGREGRRDGDV